jgi:demethylmenaquinone methyltransferase/2-methoxy-6-polyprenyl-1,4-benzoquinol methylase
MSLSALFKIMNKDMAAMFNTIAATYDIVNSTGSFGLDGFWRRRLVNSLQKTSARQVLDVACGTGVLSWVIYRKLCVEVTGLDLSVEMLREAEKKRARHSLQSCPAPVFIEGCAETLPFANQSFDAVTIAFGVRNFENRHEAFQQIYRVLRPGGHLFILDFATPKNPIWNFFFRNYFWYILPLLGQVISGNKNAYRYLPRSVTHFPQYQELCAELSKTGFSIVRYHPYTGGVAVLYTGIRKSD